MKKKWMIFSISLFVVVIILSGCLLFKAAAPTNLTAKALSSSSIQLRWSGNGNDFLIYRSKEKASDFSQIGESKTSSYTDMNLSANTTYYYEVKAKNEYGISNPSNIASTTTYSLPLKAPSLKITSYSTSTITISWTKSSTNVKGYEIYRSNDSTHFTQIATVTKGNSYTDKDLKPNTKYYYEMKAYNEEQESPYSNVVNITTEGIVPSSPSNLHVVSVTTGSVTLEWNEKFKDVNGFRIYRSTSKSGTFTEIGNSNKTRFTDKRLNCYTTYYYKVTAYNSIGESPFSNVASAMTKQQIPFTPSDLKVTAVSTNVITISWRDNSSNEEGFKIYRATDDSHFSEIATMTKDATTYEDEDLKSNTVYYYKVSAYNTAGESSSTNTVMATTDIWIPTVPVDVKVTSYSTDSITLEWQPTYQATVVIYRRSVSHNIYTIYVENGIMKAKEVKARYSASDDFTPIATLSYKVNKYTDKNLQYNTTYYYEMRAYTKYGWSKFTPIASVTTKNVLPKAPTNLKTVASTINGITLTWNDNSNNEEGFRIWRKNSFDQAYILIGTVKANTTTYTDEKPRGKNWYIVSAYNSRGNSWSNSVEVGKVALLVNDKGNLNDYDQGFIGVLKGMGINYDVIDINEVESNPSILSDYKVVVSNMMGYGETLTSRFSQIKDAIENSLKEGTQYILGTESIGILGSLGLVKTEDTGWWPTLNDTVAVTDIPFKSSITNGVNILPNWQSYLGQNGNMLSSYSGTGVYWKVISGAYSNILHFSDYVAYPTVFLKGIKSGLTIVSHPYVLGLCLSSWYEGGPVQFLVGRSRIMYLSFFWTANNNTEDKGWIGPEGEKILLNTINEYLNEEAQGEEIGQIEGFQIEGSQNGEAILKWNRVSNADRYEIWKKVGDGIWNPVGIVEGNENTTWTDEYVDAGEVNYYKVRGIDEDIPGEFSTQLSFANLRLDIYEKTQNATK